MAEDDLPVARAGRPLLAALRRCVNTKESLGPIPRVPPLLPVVSTSSRKATLTLGSADLCPQMGADGDALIGRGIIYPEYLLPI